VLVSFGALLLSSWGALLAVVSSGALLDASGVLGEFLVSVSVSVVPAAKPGIVVASSIAAASRRAVCFIGIPQKDWCCSFAELAPLRKLISRMHFVRLGTLL